MLPDPLVHLEGVMWRALLTLLMVVFVTARPAAADDWDDCRSATSERRILACTNIIDSDTEEPKRRAEAYRNRASAYSKHSTDMTWQTWALLDLNQAILLDPGLAEAHHDRAVVYRQRSFDSGYGSKRYLSRALADLKEAIRLRPRYAEAYYRRGSIYYGQKEYDLAIADYDQAISLNPKHAEAFHERSWAYGGKGDDRKATSDRLKAIELKSDYATTNYDNWSWLARNKDKSRSTIATLTKLLELRHDWPQLTEYWARAYYYRGLAHHTSGDHGAAIADFTEAVRRDSELVFHYYDPTTAIAGLDEAIRLGWPEAYVARGIVFAKKRDWDKAIGDFSEAIRASTAYPFAHYHRARAYAAKRQGDKAVDDYRAAFRDPDFSKWAASDIASQTDRRDLDAIIGASSGFPEAKPVHVAALLLRAATYVKKHDYALAAEDYNKVLELDPGRISRLQLDIVTQSETIYLNPISSEAYYRRGATYARISETHDKERAYDDAIADFSGAIDLRPDWVDAYLARARLYVQKGRSAKAIFDYSRAIELKRDLSEAYVARGRLYELMGKFAEALSDYDLAINSKTTSPEVYLARGRLRDQAGKYDDALADYSKAINLDRHLAAAYAARASTHERRGTHDKAIADYAAAAKLDPGLYVTSYTDAVVRAKKATDQPVPDSDLEQLIERLDQSALTPRDYAIRGDLHYARGDVNKASKDWRKAVALDPYLWTYYFSQGYYASTQRDPEKLISYTKGVLIRPDYALTYLTRALHYLTIGNNDEAIADYAQAIRLEPDEATSFYGRARAYLAKSHYDLALADYAKVLLLKRDNPDEYPSLLDRDIYFDRAISYFGRGDYAQATTEFINAVVAAAATAPRLFWLVAACALGGAIATILLDKVSFRLRSGIRRLVRLVAGPRRPPAYLSHHRFARLRRRPAIRLKGTSK